MRRARARRFPVRFGRVRTGGGRAIFRSPRAVRLAVALLAALASAAAGPSSTHAQTAPVAPAPPAPPAPPLRQPAVPGKPGNVATPAAAAAVSPPPKAQPVGTTPAPVTPPAINAGPERAVVFDEHPRPPAKDQLLPLEGERRAEALARYAQGLLFEDNADADGADKAFQRALALDPGNVDLALKLTQGYLRRGDSNGAIDVLKDAIKASPRVPQPLLALGYLYFRYLNKPDLALRYATQALDLDPTNPLAYQHLVEIYLSLNQPAKALAVLDRGAKADSKDPGFWLRLGGLAAGTLSQNGKAGAPADITRAGTFYERALAVAGDDPAVIEQAANFEALIERTADAAALFEKVLRLDPSNANAADKLARCNLVLGRREGAIAALEQSIRANPSQQAAYEQLGELYSGAKQLDKAADQYEQALRLNPDNRDLYRRLALVLLNGAPGGRPERAVEVFTRARKRFPDWLDAGKWLGLAMMRAKQFQPAVTVFEQTLQEARTEQDSFLDDGFFYYSYGIAAEQAGLYEKAAAMLKKTLEVGSDPELTAEASNYLGYMWIDRGENLEEAGTLVRRALDLRPDSGAYLDSLGWYYFHVGQFDKALAQLLQAATNMKEPDPTVFEHLGDTYRKLENPAQALEYWQKAAALENPNPVERERVLKKIEGAKAQVVQGNPTPAPTP